MIIDISVHNGDVNFREIATEEIKEIFIRSSLGYGDVDKNLEKNAKEAHAAGHPVSYYHFAYPHDTAKNIGEDAIKQASWFCDTIAHLPTPTHLAIDLENFSAQKDTGLPKN